MTTLFLPESGNILAKTIQVCEGKVSPFKGIVHEMQIFFLRFMIIYRYFLIVYYNLCCLVDEKIKLKGLACSFEITY
jgi:hypothetical protein